MVGASERVQQAGCAVLLMPWWHAPQTDWYGVLGRFPLGMGVLSDAASCGDRGTSVLERFCSATDDGPWWLEASVCNRPVVLAACSSDVQTLAPVDPCVP